MKLSFYIAYVTFTCYALFTPILFLTAVDRGLEDENDTVWINDLLAFAFLLPLSAFSAFTAYKLIKEM